MDTIKKWILANKFWASLIAGVLLVIAGLTENVIDDKYAADFDSLVKETIEVQE